MRVKSLFSIIYVFAMLNIGFAQPVWESREPTLPKAKILGVAYGNNLFIAVGYNGSDGMIHTSPNGVTWTVRYSKKTKSLCSVVYGNSQFITVGDSGIILTSPDGKTWTERYSGTNNILNSVAYVNDQYIAVGNGSTILTSPDGVTWTERYSGEHYLYSVTYGNNQFIVVGNSGLILTSPDGVRWTVRSSGTTNWLRSVTYGNNQFIAVGKSGVILTSPHGITWTEESAGTINDLKSVVYGNNQFIIVGEYGTILYSKADDKTPVLSNFYRKSTHPLSITNVSNHFFIQMPDTRHVGKDLRISLFNTSGKTIYVYTTKMKMTDGKFNISIPSLSRGFYHAKVTNGRSFEYYSSVLIIQ